MNPEGGYTRQYRRMWENPVFRNKQEAAVFAWMISAAQWRDARISTKFGPVDLRSGELIVAERPLSDDFGMHRNTLRALIQRLVDDGTISVFRDRCPHRAGTVVEIKNYKSYQCIETDARPVQDRSGTANETEAGPKEDRKRTKNKEVNTKKEDNTPLTPFADALPPDGGDAVQGDLNGPTKPKSKTRNRNEYPAEFERFWGAWPDDHMDRKKHAGKAGTYDAWRKACRHDDAERIIRGAQGYAESYAKLRAKGSDRADYVNGPVPWLNQKRWDGFADQAPGQPEAPPADELQWTVYLKTFAQCGKWPANKGPKPGDPGCQAPPDLVASIVPHLAPTAQIIVYPQQRIAQ